MAAKKPSAFRVGIWIECPAPGQAQGENSGHSLTLGKQYAGINGWTVAEVYHPGGADGITVREDPEYRRMMRDVEEGRIQGLVLPQPARSTGGLLHSGDCLPQWNVHPVCLEEKFDSSAPAAGLLFTFPAAAPGGKDGATARSGSSTGVPAKSGKAPGGKPPYGFQWRNRRLVQVPEEVQVRRLAYELFLEHRRKGVVARLLNEKGCRTREGNPFRDMNVRRMLECPSAVGRYRAGDTEDTVECDPIITDEIHRRTCAVLEQQSQPGHRPAKAPVSVFGGLLRCACGGRLYLGSRSPNYACRKCGNRIAAAEMDRFLLDIVQEELAGHAALEGGDIAERWPALDCEEKQQLASLVCTEIIIPTDPGEPLQITLITAPGSSSRP
jgi:site-specific DNA recombinase